MRARSAMAVSSAAFLRHIFGKFLRDKQRDIFLDSRKLGTVNPDSHLVQTGKSPCADSAHDHGIHFFLIDRFDGIAIAVSMMLIPVDDRTNRACFRVNNDKKRSRPEMAVHCARDAFIPLNGKTQFHLAASLWKSNPETGCNFTSSVFLRILPLLYQKNLW